MDDYKRMLQKARKDLEAALKQKAELDNRVYSLKQAVSALSALAGEPLSDEHRGDVEGTVDEMQGITHGIRRVLALASDPMSAPEIRDALAQKPEYKEKLDNYASPLTVIHNTLARLMRQDEVESRPMGFVLKGK